MEQEQYKKDAMGRLVPLHMISDYDLARDELVIEITSKAKALQHQMEEFKKAAMADINAFIALCGERFKVDLGGKKGNVTLRSYDGLYRINIAVAERMVFDERLIAAKTLIDQCIHRWTEGTGAEIRQLVEHAFQADRDGNISTVRVLSLLNLQIEDEEWQTAMVAIRESMQVSGTCTYLRLYQRKDGETYEQIPLDLAKVG